MYLFSVSGLFPVWKSRLHLAKSIGSVIECVLKINFGYNSGDGVVSVCHTVPRNNTSFSWGVFGMVDSILSKCFICSPDWNPLGKRSVGYYYITTMPMT